MVLRDEVAMRRGVRGNVLQTEKTAYTNTLRWKEVCMLQKL